MLWTVQNPKPLRIIFHVLSHGLYSPELCISALTYKIYDSEKTAKTITMKYMDVLGVQTQTRKLYIDSRSEYVYPEGTYGAGMDAPEWQLRADGPFIPANPQTSQPAITAPVQEAKPKPTACTR